MLEWVAISFSQIFLNQGWNSGLPHRSEDSLPPEPPGKPWRFQFPQEARHQRKILLEWLDPSWWPRSPACPNSAASFILSITP